MSNRGRTNQREIAESVRIVEVRPDGRPVGALLTDGEILKINPLEDSPGLRQLPDRWDKAQVGISLMRAFATLDMLPRAKGPRGYGSSWPAYVASWEDKLAQETRDKEHKLMERIARLHGWSQPKPKYADVTSMERCFGWVANLRTSRRPHAEREAAVVQSWAYWTFKRRRINKAMEKKGWNRRQFWSDQAAGLQWIADDLNKRRVAVY